MSSGWIKLHRQLRDSSFYGNPIPVALWVECLFRASHDSRERFIGREKVILGPGEFVMGYREMADKVGCGVATVKFWMDTFEREGMTERTRNAKGTFVKLKKWSEYQDTRTLTEQERNADGTLTEPNKNIRIKELKNYESSEVGEKERTSEGGDVVSLRSTTPASKVLAFFTDDTVREVAIGSIAASGAWEEEFLRVEVKKFCAYWTEPSRNGKKQRWEGEKFFDLRRRLSTWLNNTLKFSSHSNAR